MFLSNMMYAKRIGLFNAMNASKLLMGTLSWTIDSGNTSEGTPRANAYDGNRSTSFDLGGGTGGGSNHCYATLAMTFARSLRVHAMYAKGSSAAEQGGCVCNDWHSNTIQVNGSTVGSPGSSQSSIFEWSDATLRTGVTSASLQIQTGYSRPGGENQSGFAYLSMYEFEVQTVI